MNRRNLLKISALSSVLLLNRQSNLLSKTNSIAIVRPKALKKGDRVALISPASNVTDPMDIYKAQEICDNLGVSPILPKSIARTQSGYKTRGTQERVNEIHQAFEDKSIRAILCIRGGYGSADLLDKLDYDLIAKNPKIMCGYSDITALLNGISKKTGLVTFHAPVMLSNFNEISFNSFRNLLFDNSAHMKISNPESSRIRSDYPTLTINEGKSKGQLVGGNLSLITSLIGTDFQIDTKDKILFIEDVGEPPYSIERMLTQMRLSGMLESVKGVIIGKCDDCSSGSSQTTWDRSELEVYDYIFSSKSYPVFYGLLIGHTSTQFSIPIGINAEMDANEGSLTLLESAVI